MLLCSATVQQRTYTTFSLRTARLLLNNYSHW